MGALRERVFYGCQVHAPNWDFYCTSCTISAIGRLVDEVERLQNELDAEKHRSNNKWKMP